MNNTSSEATESDHKPPLSKAEGVTWCTAYVITAVAIVTGNLLVVVVFARSRSFRRNRFCLLVNLAVADLLVGGVAVPLDVYMVLPNNFDLWQLGESSLAVHHAAAFFALFTAYASILNLAMISLERFYATFFTFRYRRLNNGLFFLALAMTWILAALPYTFSLLENVELVSTLAYFYVRGLFAAFLLLIICLAYLCIWAKLKWGASPQRHRATQRDRKLTVTLFIITTLSLIAWLPFNLLSMVFSTQQEDVLDYHQLLRTDLALRLLLFSNSLVNPILYTMRMPVFKAEVVKIWVAVTCRGTSKPIGRNSRQRMTTERTGTQLSTRSRP